MAELKRFKVMRPEEFLYVEANSEVEAIALAAAKFHAPEDDLIAWEVDPPTARSLADAAFVGGDQWDETPKRIEKLELNVIATSYNGS